MESQSKAWQLAMALVASGKIPFDLANPEGSIKWLKSQVEVFDDLLETLPAPVAIKQVAH